jgi:DNA polymerase
MERTEITLDFETYYDKKSKYFLKNKNSGLTIEQYIRNPKFEVIGLSVKVGNRPSEWLFPHEIEEWLNHVEIAYGWDNVRLIAHNGRFDCAILGWIYNIYPGQIADTMLMSRAAQLWDGNSLDVVTHQLRDVYKWGIIRDDAGNTTWGHLSEEEMLRSLDKGDEVISADGKHLMDFTDEEYDAYSKYGCTDVDLTWSAYNWFMREFKFPELEIDVMTATIETFTYPVVELHEPVLKVVRDMVNGKRDALLSKVGATLSDLRSDDKFAELLRNLGVEPPTKLNAKGQTKYAFAKKDLDFLRLLEHEDPNVVELVEARLGNKSSQAVTRVERFFELASRNPMPMPLEYYAAHTGRWGGCLTSDTLVICLTAEQQVVHKKIVDVLLSDLVWDGVEFVEHEGVKFSGYQEVITHDGITGTACHPVFINDTETISLSEAMRTGTKIMDCQEPSVKRTYTNGRTPK